MSGFKFAQDIFSFLTDLIHGGIGDIVVSLSEPISGIMFSALFLYSVYLAYSMLMSRNPEILREGIKVFILLGVVTTFALKTDYYISNVVPIVLNLGDELGALATKSPDIGSGAAIDRFSTVIASTISQIWKGMSGIEGSLMGVACTAIILIGAIPFAVTTIGVLIMAKVMVALLLSVGTIFICFALFPQTRPWFQQWINMCWNYSLVSILFPIALAFLMKAVDTFVFTDGMLHADITSCLKLAIVMLAFNTISTQIPTLASSLSGGVGINGMTGSFSSMINNIKNVGRGLKSVGRGAYGAGRGARNLGGRISNARKERRNPNIKAG